jgi:uncharacterized protein (TIGR03382 family)
MFDAVRRSLCTLVALAALLALPSTAAAGELSGQLVDSLTGTPIGGATVEVLGTQRVTRTDRQGRWSFDLPDGEYELRFQKTLGDRHHRFRLVNQHVPQYKPADSWLPTTYFMDRGVPRVDKPLGAPVRRPDHPSDRSRGPRSLDDLPTGGGTFHPGDLTLPDTTPTTIRVARRSEKENCGNPIVAIEEMTLSEYVKGVLPPEIGVFRNLNNVTEVYKAFGVAAKSYGLYFMLVYGPGNRRTVSSAKPPNNFTWFHIDDTPCNQRYSDTRYTITSQAAQSMSGKLLVKEGAKDTLDKYEYAASCAEHGSRPEYQTAIVDDDSPTRSCVGSWCGHDDCAAHEDHPDVPGQDRCLVRGICQWGAAEWAEGGKSSGWLLDHYQPNLMLRDLDGGTTMPETVELTGFVYTDPADIANSGVSGATVSLQGGDSTTTDASGRFTFDAVDLSKGTVTLTASKSGYRSNQRDKMLAAGMTNWASIQLTPDSGDATDTGTPTVDTGPAADTAPTGDTGLAGDTGSGPADTTGADTSEGGPTNYGSHGGLGSLVSTSAGVEGGCSTPAQRKKPAGGALAAAVLLAVAMLRRRVC